MHMLVSSSTSVPPNRPIPSRRWFRKKRYLIPLILFLTPGMLITGWMLSQWHGPRVISIETTGITEPLTTDGRPDYETAFQQLQQKWQPEAFTNPSQNGFARWLALRGPRYLIASEKSWPENWADCPTDPRTSLCWNRFWLPACTRFQIAPYAEPPFLHYEDSLSAMKRQKVTHSTKLSETSETAEQPPPVESPSHLPQDSFPHDDLPHDSPSDDSEKMTPESPETSDGLETISQEVPEPPRELERQVEEYVVSLRSQPWLAAENSEAAEWLQKAEPGLNAWIETLQLPYDEEWDIVADHIAANRVEELWPSLSRQIEEGKMVHDLLVRIQNRIAMGNYDAAMDDLRCFDWITERAWRSADIVVQLIGVQTHRLSNLVVAQLLTRTDLPMNNCYDCAIR